MIVSKILLAVLTGGALLLGSMASVQAAEADGGGGRMWTGSHHRMHGHMHRKMMDHHHGNSTRRLENGTASGKGSGPRGGSPNG